MKSRDDIQNSIEALSAREITDLEDTFKHKYYLEN